MPRRSKQSKTLCERKQTWSHYELAALCVLLNPTPKADGWWPCTRNLAIETSGKLRFTSLEMFLAHSIEVWIDQCSQVWRIMGSTTFSWCLSWPPCSWVARNGVWSDIVHQMEISDLRSNFWSPLPREHLPSLGWWRRRRYYDRRTRKRSWWWIW